MQVKVRFRVNKSTGEVEVFEVDDLGSNLPEAEHNRAHDRIAAELGAVIERNARVIEHLPGLRPPTSSAEKRPAEAGEDTIETHPGTATGQAT